MTMYRNTKKRHAAGIIIKKKPPSKLQNWLRRGVEGLIIIAIFLGIQAWVQRDMVSGAAPAISNTTLQGIPVSIESYAGEDPYIIHFWATWCPVCDFEKGMVNSVAQDWNILSIATFENTLHPPQVLNYMKENGIDNWPTLYDKKNLIAEQYGVKGVPSTYIVDRNGIIRFKTSGYTSSWGLRFRLWLTKVIYR